MKVLHRYTRIVFLILFVFPETLMAQKSNFVLNGTITYVKRENVFAILNKYYLNDKNESVRKFAKDYQTQNQQFKQTYFNLEFTATKTAYQAKQEDNNQPDFLDVVNSGLVLQLDLIKKTYMRKEKVLGEIYIINDSLRKIKWRLTDETREILGYKCRRANAIIQDSIYVVAFYTDQIVPAAGPSIFNGLPGMILEVALPHEHITWQATQIIANSNSFVERPIQSNKLPITNKSFNAILDNYPTIKDDSTYMKFVRNRVFF